MNSLINWRGALAGLVIGFLVVAIYPSMAGLLGSWSSSSVKVMGSAGSSDSDEHALSPETAALVRVAKIDKFTNDVTVGTKMLTESRSQIAKIDHREPDFAIANYFMTIDNEGLLKNAVTHGEESGEGKSLLLRFKAVSDLLQQIKDPTLRGASLARLAELRQGLKNVSADESPTRIELVALAEQASLEGIQKAGETFLGVRTRCYWDLFNVSLIPMLMAALTGILAKLWGTVATTFGDFAMNKLKEVLKPFAQ